MLQGPIEWFAVPLAVGIVAVIVGWTLIEGLHDGKRVQHTTPAAEQGVPDQSSPSAPPTRTPRVSPSTNRFTFSATRGDSWLSVHSSSVNGPVLFEGILARGRMLRLRSRTLWIRFGAAANIDLRVNGRRTELPLFGTFDAKAGPRGVRPVRTRASTHEGLSTTAAVATFLLAASRGDSWLLVRSASEHGRLLFEGTLERGESVTFRAVRLWIWFGAAANVDVSIDGTGVALPVFGTVDAVVDRRGVRRAGGAPLSSQATAAQSP